MGERCNIQHQYAGCRCIRAKGHDGLCWSPAERNLSGFLLRCLWYSKDGKFESHHTYEYTRPSAVTAKESSDG